MKLPLHREFPAAACTARLNEHLKVASRLYPRAWRLFDQVRAQRDDLGGWPAWCFCPLAGSYSIICDHLGVENLDRYARRLAYSGDEAEDAKSPSLDIARLGGLGAWRSSQGVYVIDPTILDAVLETPINGAIPVDVLLTLPQWCVYVPTPDFQMEGRPVLGFFAFLEHDANTNRTELRLLIDEGDRPPFHGLRVEVLHLYPGITLQESYERMLDEAGKQATRAGVASPDYLAAREAILEMGSSRLAPILSVLFYLCSQTAEYRPGGATASSRPAHPAAKKTKEGWRFFPPDRPSLWFVGERLGRAIRDALGSDREGEGGLRSGPRPHVRSAHWHGFWSGPRKGARKFQLRWLPPIAVALADDSPEARMRHAKLKPIRDLDAEIGQIRNELENRDAPPSAG